MTGGNLDEDDPDIAGFLDPHLGQSVGLRSGPANDGDIRRSCGILVQAAGVGERPGRTLAVVAINAAAAGSGLARRRGDYAWSARCVPVVQSARTCRARSSLV